MIYIILIISITLLLLKRFNYTTFAKSIKNEYFIIAICVYILMHMRQVKAQYEYYTSNDESANPLSFNGTTQNIDPDSNYYTRKIVDKFLQGNKLIIPGNVKINGNVVLNKNGVALSITDDNVLSKKDGSHLDSWNPNHHDYNTWNNILKLQVFSGQLIDTNTISCNGEVFVDGKLTMENHRNGYTECKRLENIGDWLDVESHVQIGGALNFSNNDYPYDQSNNPADTGELYRNNEDIRLNDRGGD